MNSYKVLKCGLGYYGYEINDGEINDDEAYLYQSKDITTKFINSFPNKSSYSLYKEFGRDYFEENLTGEEVQILYDKLDESLYLKLFYQSNPDYNILINDILTIYENIYKLLENDLILNDDDTKLEMIKQLLNSLGFNISVIDKDYLTEIVRNIQNWYLEEE